MDAFEGLLDAVRHVLPYAADLRPSSTSELERAYYLTLTEESFEVPGWLLSTGTLRIVALLACLRHPKPPPLLIVEEIENGLDPRTLHLLVERDPANHPLNDRQRLALVYLRQHGQITNPDYRRLNRVDPLVAGRELRSLVESALVEQEGTRRWTSYRLQVSPDVPAPQIELSTEEKEILAWISEKKSITNKECRQLLGVGPTRAYYLLKRLCDAKHIKSTGAGKGRSYSLP